MAADEANEMDVDVSEAGRECCGGGRLAPAAAAAALCPSQSQAWKAPKQEELFGAVAVEGSGEAGNEESQRLVSGPLSERSPEKRESEGEGRELPKKACSSPGPPIGGEALARERALKRRMKKAKRLAEEQEMSEEEKAMRRKRRNERKKKKERRRSRRFETSASSSSVLRNSKEEARRKRKANKTSRSKSTPEVSYNIDQDAIIRPIPTPIPTKSSHTPPLLSTSDTLSGLPSNPEDSSPKRRGQYSTRQKRDTPAPMTFRHFHDFILAADSDDVAPMEASDGGLTRTKSMEQLQVMANAVPTRCGTVTPPRSYRHGVPERSRIPSKRSSVLMSTDVNERKSIYELPSLRTSYTPFTALHKGTFSKHFKLMEPPTEGAGLTNCVPQQGTLVDIVEWAFFFPKRPFVKYLLLCFRSLFTPSELLEAVIAITNKHEDPSTNMELLERLYLFVSQWLLLWGAQDVNSAVRSDLLGFVQQMFSNTMKRASNHIKLIVLEGAPPGTKLGTFPFVPEEVVEAARKRKGRRRIPAREKKLRSRSNRLMLSIRGAGAPEVWRLASESLAEQGPDLLQFPNILIAQQLTLLHVPPFRSVGLLEYLGCKWQKENKGSLAPSLTKVSEDFNRLSLWVATTIVTAEAPKRQSQLYKKFIRLAQNLLDIRNYSCCVAVISGLNNIAVTRLEHIRAGVSEKYLSILARVDNVLNPVENYKEYRRLPRTFPYVPFMPVHLRDISVIHETMRDFSDESKTVVNFEKMHALGEAIYSIGIEQTGANDFEYEPDDMLQSLIVAMMQRNLTEDELYSRSVNAKPVRMASGAMCVAPDVPLLIEDSKSLSPEMFNGKYHHMVKKEVDGLRGKSLFTLMLSEEPASDGVPH